MEYELLPIAYDGALTVVLERMLVVFEYLRKYAAVVCNLNLKRISCADHENDNQGDWKEFAPRYAS